MKKHGSKTPKRTLCVGNRKEIASLDLGDLLPHEWEVEESEKLTRVYFKDGKKHYVGTRKLKQSQILVSAGIGFES